MASYLPPTEDVPIFDNTNFEHNNIPLTYNEATKGFLAFPNAQGNENFQDITVYGTTDFLSIVTNQSTMPSPLDASEIVPTTAWVQDAIAAAPSNPNISTTSTTSATPLPIPILSTATPGSASLYVDSDNGITYTPSTNTLTVTQVNGNASTATLAGRANSVGITNNLTNADYPIPFLRDQVSPTIIYTDSTNAIKYNPSLDTLTVTNITGTVSNATNATNAVNATNAANVYNNGTNGNQNYPIAYLGSASVGNTTISGDTTSHYTFNPNQNLVSLTGNQTMSSATSLLTINSTGTAISCPSATAISFPSANVTATTFTGTATRANTILTGTTNSTTINLVGGLTNATTYQQLYMANSLPLTYFTLNGSLGCPIMNATTSISAPIIQTTNNGVIRTYDTGGVLATTMQQLGSDLNILIPATGEMKITTQGTGVIPTANADAGTSILWNVSAGGGESCIVNYQDGGTTGGFDFYNVNGSSPAVKIASIPKTQSAFSTASSTILPSYDWVNGTVSAAISGIVPITTIPVNNTTSNTEYYLPIITSTSTGQKTVYAGGTMTYNPSLRTLSNMSSVTITNGTQIQSIFTEDDQMVLQADLGTMPSAYYFKSRGYNQFVPVGFPMPTAVLGMQITRMTRGVNETDFANYVGASTAPTAGGFSFYTGGSVLAMAEIGYLPRQQPVSATDTSVNIPTNNYMQRAIRQGGGAPITLYSGTITTQAAGVPPILTDLYELPYLVPHSTWTGGTTAVSILTLTAQAPYFTNICCQATCKQIGSNQDFITYMNSTVSGSDIVFNINTTGGLGGGSSQTYAVFISITAVPLASIS